MPTKPITITHDGADLVCHHSGLPPSECPSLDGLHCRWPTVCDEHATCFHTFVACPDEAEVYARAEVLRTHWPTARFDKQEGREWDVDIPSVKKVTDHMRRKSEPHEQR